MNSHQTELKIAQALLDLGAIFLSPSKPFTWASGILSPIYCDNRISLSHPPTRSLIADSFVSLIQERYPDTELIAAVATAGIAHAALVADRMNLPLVYVRAQAKSHGRENLIEGRFLTGQKTILIEDLISTAGSSIQAAQALREAGLELQSLISIFNYGLSSASQNLSAAQLSAMSLSNYDTLLELALRQGLIGDSDLSKLQDWRRSPPDWRP